MSKILKNNTGSPITFSDTGVTIAASPAQYTIPPQDYLLWAASDDVITEIGAGNIIVNDGSNDLGVSDGTDLIKGVFNEHQNEIDSNNSTTTPLGISGVFTGTGTDVSLFTTVTVILYADQDSASDGISFQFSSDDTNWDDVNTFTLTTSDSSTRRFQFPITAQYFRLVYTNGTTAQTAFRVQTILHRNVTLTSIHRVDDSLSSDRSCTLTKSVITGKDSEGIYQNLKLTETGSMLVDLPQGRKDSFDRLRVTNPTTLFDHSFTYDTNFSTLWSTSTTGTGTVTHDSTTGQRILSTGGTASGAKAILQTRRRIQYVKGKSQVVMFTGSFNSLQANVRKRAGLFDSSNGVFFETDGTSLYAVRRTNTSGSVVDSRTVSSSWNIDTLDGTGGLSNPSGLTADPTKHYIFVIDFSWLGAGVIRYGILVEGTIVYVHKDSVSGTIALPWSFSAHLPLRFEIENTGTASSSDSIDITCCTVASEGGDSDIGTVRTVDTGSSAVSVNTTAKVVAGIRLKSTSLNASIKALAFNLTGASGSTLTYYQVIYNGTLSGDTWSAVTSLSEGLTNNPTYTAGTGLVLDSGYFDLGGTGSKALSGSQTDDLDTDIYLGFDIAGTADTIILVVQTVSSSGSILFSGQFREFS